MPSMSWWVCLGIAAAKGARSSFNWATFRMDSSQRCYFEGTEIPRLKVEQTRSSSILVLVHLR